MRRSGLAAASLAGALALACSACGGPSRSTAGSHHKKHHHHGPSTTTSTSSSTTTSTSTTLAGLARCTYADLDVTAGQGGAGLGHEGFAILFRNVGTSTCALQGYPGVAALNSSGQQAEQAQRTPSGYLGGLGTGSTTPPLVQLAPGATASAFVEGTDVPVGTETSCPTYQALLVTPPTTTQSKRLTQGVPGCSPIQIHPVVPGATGRTT